MKMAQTMKTPIYLRKDEAGGGAWLHDFLDNHLGYIHSAEVASIIVGAVNSQAAAIEQLEGVASRKLSTLVDQGWQISGSAISKQTEDGSWRHGFVTDGGFVGWHHPA